MKEEFQKIIRKNENNIVSFYYEEEKKKWEIRVLENDNVIWESSLTYEEGLELLLTYFLIKQSITLEQTIDTIKMRSYDDRILGYIRSVEKSDIITEKQDLIANTLYSLFTLFRKRNQVNIFCMLHTAFVEKEVRLNFCGKNEFFSIKGEEKILKEVLKFIIDKILSELNVQEISNTDTEYNFGNIIISKEDLEESEKRKINKKIIKKNLDSYQHFLKSNIGKSIKEVLDEEDSQMSLRREN